MAEEQVFLSYSHADVEACSALRAALEQAGIAVFRDEESLRVGDRWMERLQHALEHCTAFIVLVGRDGVRRWVGAEVQVALSRHLSAHDDAQRLPIFPVLLEGAGPDALPPFLALVQSARWPPDEPVPAALIESITTRTNAFEYPHKIDGCPFLGLSAFRRKDATLFFGRRKETLEALAGLGSQQDTNPERVQGSSDSTYHRWLQIEGNSGTGKSSLVNAGMLPMIEQGALWARTGYEHWHILGPMMPGKDPLANLAEALEHGLIAEPAQRDTRARRNALRDDSEALVYRLRDFKQDDTAFLLIVDQFEELFTFADEAPRKQFDALLAHALQDPQCPLFVISTVRADFLDRFERLPHLQAIYNSRCKRYFLPTVSEHGLREIIEQPARLAGLDVSEITTAILDDARSEIGALPLVENALFILWQQREGNRLSGARYGQEKGIAGMLSTQADALLERIDGAVPKGKQAALELLLRLTRINDEGRHTRQRVTRQEAVLVAGNGNVANGERVVNLLTGERAAEAQGSAHTGALRLITTSQEQGEQYVDLIHETLIRARDKDEKTGKLVGYWPTLYDYTEKNRDRDVYRQQLKFQTEAWLKNKGLGRLWDLALWDLRHYRALRIPPNTPEGRFLSWSRWARHGVMVMVSLFVAFVGDAYYWTRKHDLPLDSILTLQRYRLGYAPIPELVAIPAGSFDMGEQDRAFLGQYQEKDHKYLGVPAHRVEIAKGFSLGRHEVTYDQFDYYVRAQQRAGRDEVAFPTTAKGGRGNRPVVNVNWGEATAYAIWLGDRIGRSCSLPTEAQWEYAGRARTITGYWWGDEVGENNANCNGCGSQWDNDQSAPVGRFPPNAFGLYDTVGNVWEWTCSPWRERFDGSEQQCVEEEDSVARVVRGGSWSDDAVSARSASRSYFDPVYRYDDIGFRVLCLSPIE